MPADRAIARRLLATLDLTSLGESDDRTRIAALCRAAATCHGTPAAVCVHPEWIVFARDQLDLQKLAHVAVASVANFPDGSSDPARVEREVARAVAAGAAEVDVVFPWRTLLAGDADPGRAVVAAARRAAPGRVLKLILETGELPLPLVPTAARIALDGGADFLKTSTGKAPRGASLPAAGALLQALRAHGGRAGFKASGGVRTLADASAYLELADRIMGAGWATAARFRVGSSTLLAELGAVLDAGETAP